MIVHVRTHQSRWMVSYPGMGEGTPACSDCPMPQPERQMLLQTHSPPDCCSPGHPDYQGSGQFSYEPSEYKHNSMQALSILVTQFESWISHPFKFMGPELQSLNRYLVARALCSLNTLLPLGNHLHCFGWATTTGTGMNHNCTCTGIRLSTWIVPYIITSSMQSANVFIWWL